MIPTLKQLDIITELINIGIGKGASVLNTMIDSPIILTVPFIKILTPLQLEEEIGIHDGKKLSTVNLPFKGNLTGNAQLIFPSESAVKLIDIFAGEESDSEDMDSIRAGALCEIGNVVLNAVMGSLSNLLKFNLNYTVPNYIDGFIREILPSSKNFSNVRIIMARAQFKIEKLAVNGDIVLFLEVGSFDKLLEAVDIFDMN